MIRKSLLMLGGISCIKNKRLTDIKLDTIAIEAGVALANLMGFDYDPSEANEEQTA